MLPFAKNLERMGITARVRTVDVAQYEKRMETFDFDMAVVVVRRNRCRRATSSASIWGSKAADEPGSRNLIGIKSPVIDELIEELISGARPREPRRPHPRARPGAAIRLLRDPAISTSRRLGSPIGTSSAAPTVSPKYGVGLDTWWVDPAAEQTIEAKKGEATKK